MGLFGLILLPFFLLIMFALLYPMFRTKGKPISGTMIPKVSWEEIRERVDREISPYDRIPSYAGSWHFKWRGERIFEMDYVPGNYNTVRRLHLRVEYRDGVIHYGCYGMAHIGHSKLAEMNRLEGKLKELISK